MQDLQKNGCDLVGTLRVNRAGVPQRLKNVTQFAKKSSQGDMRYVRDRNTVNIQWRDSKMVTLISSIHSATDFVWCTRHTKENG